MTLLDIFDPKAPPMPIGIDLGTTNSLVAYVRQGDGRATTIRDCDLAALLPSVVHYGDKGQVVVGSDAARLAAAHPSDTIVSVKRFMGRGADDAEVSRLGSYRFVAPENDEQKRTVRFSVRDRIVSPIEVSAEILRELRERAEDELGSVGGVVITVPAYFDDAQRQATKDAAKLAGLQVLRLLNEPTAAALAYGLETKKNGTFAVYDLGGGTFDVTILALDDGVFQVRSTGGDTALGGDDFDRAIVNEVFFPAMGVVAKEASPSVIRLVLDAAKQAKHALTTAAEVGVSLPKQGGGEVSLTLTRARFDEVIRPVVERTFATCRRALRDAELTANDLDGVILVGGATRVPLVRQEVARVFAREPLTDLDPDEVVALGAAIQANQLAGEATDEVLLLDVLPLSLGIATMGGVVDKILPRNTTIPASARSTFTTYADNQTGFEIHVVQGERELAADCRSLATFFLKGIPPMPAGMARLDVTFHVDADGLLSVTAKEATTGIEQKVEVSPTFGLDDETVEQMLLDALDSGEADLAARRLAEERVEAERTLLATQKSIEADASLLEQGEDTTIRAAMENLRRSLGGTNAALIHANIEALDHATHAFAGRRMDRAIASAIAGQNLGDVEAQVAHAKGIENAHAK
jgi:molecular chaperone HscA